LIARSARVTDPETSHAAGASVRNVTEVQRCILWLLAEWSRLTDEDIQSRYIGPRASQSGLRTRRAELVKAGKVRDSGQRKRLSSGREAIVWELS
jgi:hypothetical protein